MGGVFFDIMFDIGECHAICDNDSGCAAFDFDFIWCCIWSSSPTKLDYFPGVCTYIKGGDEPDTEPGTEPDQCSSVQCNDCMVCNDGNCVADASQNGSTCDDQDSSTENDECNDGMCKGTTLGGGDCSIAGGEKWTGDRNGKCQSTTTTAEECCTCAEAAGKMKWNLEVRIKNDDITKRYNHKG
eukprot:TRINITY_DN14100_c0_g1_i1.p1 TRINITY_DN14100_c0_g1~~TRINITY_DN14100_c0_g1_i1.p1  ORF type:complete len:184 (-),score=39.20 TRINITY_DN14100_c0_g1_i1:215-766(-)